MTRSLYRGLAAMCLALFIFGCAGGLEADKKKSTNRIETYIASQSKIDPETASEMRAYRLRNGMSEAEVRATWGAPEEVLDLTDGITEWRDYSSLSSTDCGFPAASPTSAGIARAPGRPFRQSSPTHS